MADVILDCKGIVRSMPIAKTQQKAREMQPGQTLEVVADCSSFESDIKDWCTKTNHLLISCPKAEVVCLVTIKF